MDVTSGLGYPRKTQGTPQNRITRLAGPIDRSPRSYRVNATGATCRNPREKRGSRSDRRSADILAISSSEQRFRYIPLQRIPGISGVNEAAPRPICYVTTPAWASRLGLDISGTAVMNDFCLPPGPNRDKELQHVRTWIDHSAELDAPTVRILSGNWLQGTPDDELAKRVIQAIENLMPHAIARGVTLALENHGGGVTTTADELLRIVRAVKGANFGVNLDTGNFHGADPYAEIAQVAPYAVNVQVKTEIRRKGRSKEAADLSRTIGILREARYSGYVVLEYNASEDAMTAVPRYIKLLRSLIS